MWEILPITDCETISTAYRDAEKREGESLRTSPLCGCFSISVGVQIANDIFKRQMRGLVKFFASCQSSQEACHQGGHRGRCPGLTGSQSEADTAGQPDRWQDTPAERLLPASRPTCAPHNHQRPQAAGWTQARPRRPASVVPSLLSPPSFNLVRGFPPRSSEFVAENPQQ